MHNEEDLEKNMQEFRRLSGIYSSSEARRRHLEHMRKVSISILKKKAKVEGVKTSADQDTDARSNKDYLDVLDDLNEATIDALRAELELELVRREFFAWQTLSSNRRASMMNEKKGYGA